MTALTRAIARAPWHIRVGRCSGFRWCCVAFYVLAWSPLVELDDRARALRDRYVSLSGHVGYIRCPRCIAVGSKVEVRDCDSRLRDVEALDDAEQRAWARFVHSTTETAFRLARRVVLARSGRPLGVTAAMNAEYERTEDRDCAGGGAA